MLVVFFPERFCFKLFCSSIKLTFDVDFSSLIEVFELFFDFVFFSLFSLFFSLFSLKKKYFH